MSVCEFCGERDTDNRPCSCVPEPQSAIADSVAPELPTPSASLVVDEAVPCPSSLVPCATEDEPEVEALLRMHAEGRLDPVPVDLPDLPPTATEPMRLVADFFALVRGLRLAAGDDREVPFATRWVGEKVRLPHRTAARALAQLAAHGVLVHSGAMPPRVGKGTRLYTPGAVVRADVIPLRTATDYREERTA